MKEEAESQKKEGEELTDKRFIKYAVKKKGRYYYFTARMFD